MDTLKVFWRGGEDMPWFIGGAIVLWLISTITYAKSDEKPDNRTPEEKDREERFWDSVL